MSVWPVGVRWGGWESISYVMTTECDRDSSWELLCLSWLGTWHSLLTCHCSHAAAPPSPGLCPRPSAPRGHQHLMWGQHGHQWSLSCVSWLCVTSLSLLSTTLGWTLINIPSASAVGEHHQPLRSASHWSLAAQFWPLIGWLCEAVCESVLSVTTGTAQPGRGQSEAGAGSQHQPTQNRIRPEPGTGYYEHLRDNLRVAHVVSSNYPQKSYKLRKIFFLCEQLSTVTAWWVVTGAGAVSAVCTPGHTLPDFCHKITGNGRASTRSWPASEGEC